MARRLHRALEVVLLVVGNVETQVPNRCNILNKRRARSEFFLLVALFVYKKEAYLRIRQSGRVLLFVKIIPLVEEEVRCGRRFRQGKLALAYGL